MKTSSLYPLVFDAIKDPLILVDQHGIVVLANAAAVSIFTFGDSHSLAAVKCAEPECVFDARDISELMKNYDSIRDYMLRNRNGRDSGIVLDVDPVYVKDDEPSFKLLHFRNRSPERKRELWRDEMISMVSHEIKNPLSAMKNSVDILLSQAPGELTEGQKRFLSTSGRNIDRLTHLLDGFLDVSRINEGVFEVDRDVVDVRGFIGDVVSSFTTLFNVKRVNLDWNVEGNVTRGYLDTSKIEQVVMNLLSNALKFTPEDGNITICVKTAGVEKLSDDLRLLPWESLGEPRLLEIAVEDNGLGMSTETLNHLFNRYDHNGNAGDSRGAHLGLSISKALVEAQEGWLDIVSQLGIGTKASIFIPQDRNTACLLQRMRSLTNLFSNSQGARRSVSLFILGKIDGENWDDIFRSWPYSPVINPGEDVATGNTFRLWTIDNSLAVALVLEQGDEENLELESYFGRQFVQRNESSYLFNGYAMGACDASSGSGSFTQTFNIAMRRMNDARVVLARSTAEKTAQEIESMVIDLGS